MMTLDEMIAMDDRAERTYRTILHAHGVKLSLRRMRRTKKKRRTYNGRTIVLDAFNQTRDKLLSAIAHEVAHALTSPPQFLHEPEWGFNCSYESTRDESLRMKDKRLRWWSGRSESLPDDTTWIPGRVERETIASLLGIVLRRFVEGRGPVTANILEHGWAADLFGCTLPTYRELVRAKLLVWNGKRHVPEILLRLGLPTDPPPTSPTARGTYMLFSHAHGPTNRHPEPYVLPQCAE